MKYFIIKREIEETIRLYQVDADTEKEAISIVDDHTKAFTIRDNGILAVTILPVRNEYAVFDGITIPSFK